MKFASVVTAVLGIAAVSPAHAQEAEVSRTDPFAKPFLIDEQAVKLGGYVDAHYRLARVDGFAEEAGFELSQVNLFVFAPLLDRVRFATELEIEDGGEEITLELAMLEVDIASFLAIRAGILLSPIGRFNLVHDAPTNDFVDRPLVARRVIPTTISEPGAGFVGSFIPFGETVVAYEAYLVNGFDEGIATDPVEDDSLLEAGKGNFVDNNLYPSFVGKVTVSPIPAFDVGVSGHSGPYNRWQVEGLVVDTRRDVTILAADTEIRLDPVELRSEAALARVDLPPGLEPLRGERLGGVYAEVVVHVLDGAIVVLPDSVFTLGARYGFVDHNLDATGDHIHRATLGLNFRPIERVVFKFDVKRDFITDPDLNLVHAVTYAAAAAAYF